MAAKEAERAAATKARADTANGYSDEIDALEDSIEANQRYSRDKSRFSPNH